MGAWKDIFAMWVGVPVVLVGLSMGCGDSGGSSVPERPPGYNGATTQAVISPSSAAAISKTLFVQTQSQQSLSSVEGLYLGQDQGLPPSALPFLEQGISATKGVAAPSLPLTKAPVTSSNTIDGACGGTLTLATTIDAAAGEYDIKVTYDAFCFEGITLNGLYTLSVNADGDGLFAGAIDVRYTRHVVTEPEGTQRYEGALKVTWSGDHMLQTWNYSVTNLTTGLGAQYASFDIKTELTATEVTWTQTGRFYHPVYGYVDVATEVPFAADASLELPHTGCLKMTGVAATGGPAFGWFEVSSEGFQVTVDANGDGTVDGNSGVLTWNFLGLP
ncbi:hypothetical protein [Desulfoluna sp.]|uniref:hypothetical protein n=1 Tax=Desulfoluna sp. TaxID=2045199 RepID=UPI002604EDDB|nr:hypothetical protein [Desulfoluna sp.]